MINFTIKAIITPLITAPITSQRWGGRGDLTAGLLLAAIAIPEQLATARLVGMPAQTGLYTFIAGAVGFAVFGTNRYLSVGADTTIAPIIAGGLAMSAVAGGGDYAARMALLAVMVGFLLVVAAVVRAGWIADLLSVPVITGFLAGVSVHIVVGQWPSLLGLADVSGSLPMKAWVLLGAVRHINPWAAGIGLGVLAMTAACERLAPRWPGALLALLGVSLLSGIGQFERHGVEMVGALPTSLPRPALPDWQDALHLLPLALVVALVCLMQTASVLRAFPSQADGPHHVAHDFGGVGAGCILAGLFGGFAVNASPPRTAVVKGAGGSSQWASLVAALMAVIVLMAAGGLLAFLPRAALAGILISVAARIFRLRDIIRIFKLGGSEGFMVLASALMVVILPIQTGMILGVVLSLMHGLYFVARPRCAALSRAPGTTVWWPAETEQGETVAGVLVFAPAAPLNFTNAGFFRSELHRMMDGAVTPVRLVVIEASGMIDLDYTGAGMLCQLIAALRAGGTDVAIARLSAERARQQAARTGLLDTLGPGHLFRTVEDAVNALQPRA